MSLPGLGLLAPTVSASTPVSQAAAGPTIQNLAPNSEWRFEVTPNMQIQVKVIPSATLESLYASQLTNFQILSGNAEIFGTELAVGHVYSFTSTKAAIFTWQGCRIEITGSCEEYTAEETPMTSYANAHFALENLRQAALRNGAEGPRVLVVGPSNSGKTSLVKLLTAYATRMGRQPLVVNTDSREGMLSIPGSLTATVFASIIDVEEGWGSSPTSGPSPVPVKLPLCYYYGLPSPEDNPKLFKPVLTRLALAATSRLTDDEEVKQTGMIIDTPGVISQGKGGYDLLSHVMSEFQVNVLLVLGSERLHSDMIRRFSTHRTTNDEPITVLKLDKSGGCADRDDAFMAQTRQAQIREYFFGDSRRTLSPNTQTVDFSAVTVYKIRESSTMLSSFLPGGEEEQDSPLFDKVEPTSMMSHCILAVMYAHPHDPQEIIRDASVMGFVYVAEVDEKKRRLKILTPLSGKLGDRPLIWGSWPEAALSLIG